MWEGEQGRGRLSMRHEAAKLYFSSWDYPGGGVEDKQPLGIAAGRLRNLYTRIVRSCRVRVLALYMLSLSADAAPLRCAPPRWHLRA